MLLMVAIGRMIYFIKNAIENQTILRGASGSPF
jgi:hypothetical protein